MSERSYLIKPRGAALLGIAALAASAAVFLFAPYTLPLVESLMPLPLGVFSVHAAMIVVWAAIYLAAFICITIYNVSSHVRIIGKTGNSVKNAKERERSEDSEDKKEEEE